MKKCLPCLALMVSLPTAVAASDDPWILVPALPTACYVNQDNFSERVAAAIVNLDEEISAHRAINDDMDRQVGDLAEADPFETAQRMQAYLMSNPEEGMKMMENLYSTGQTIHEESSATSERESQLTASFDDLIVRYRAAYSEMRAQIDARLAALPTIAGEGGDSLTEEAVAQLPAINRQASIAYEQLCAKWWQPGPFSAPLTKFRAFLTDEKVPWLEKIFEQGRQQWDIQGIDTSEARSTAAMEAAQSYLKQLQRIYAERLEKPINIHAAAGGWSE